MTSQSSRTSYVPSNRRRVLCVFPKYSKSFGTFHHAYRLMKGVKAFMPPQGILLIAAYLPESWEVRFVDENIRPVTRKDIDWSDAVMVSGMHIQRPRIQQINEMAHQCGKITALGGPSVSGCPEWYPEFDLLHVGEMGDSTDALIAYLDAHTDRPAAQLRFETRQRRPLTQFPIPAYHLIQMDQYFLASIQFSSGCPYHCEFCDIPELYGSNPRLKTPQQVTAELDAIIGSGPITAVYFVDDNFVGNRKATLEMMPHLVEWQKRHQYPVEFACEATLNMAHNTDLLELMREAYFTTVFCGIETPDTEALNAMGKKQNLKVPVLDAIRTLNDHGMEVVSGIILGLDTDTPDTADRILEFIRISNIPMLTINLLMALPRTPLWRRLEKEGRIIENDEGLESNVRFLLPYKHVVEQWRYCISKAYEPKALYARFEYQRDHTFANRKKIPAAGRATPAKMLSGLTALAKVILHAGVLSDYRDVFWKMAKPALKKAEIEYVIHTGLVSYHLIRFARECAQGDESASFYSQRLRDVQEGSVEPRLVG